jgi:dihydroorotase
MSLVIKGASLLGEQTRDLYVDDAGVLVDEAPSGAETIDADGLVALPGLVDLHTHLREPGREDAETILTGSQAAALGGYTAVLAMANTSPVTDTAEAATRVWELGREAGLVHVQPVGAVTRGLAGEELAELGLMHRSRAAVKVFSDDGKCVHDARVMRRALEYVKAFGGVVSQHSQDPTLAGPAACCHEGELSGRLGLPGWPGIAEEVIVARDVMLARHTGSRVHVAHVSTAGSVEVLRWAKAQAERDGTWAVTAEVTPHHLLLTTDLLTGYDPTYKVNPPLRPQEDVDALREALTDGTIDAVATDHAPHARHDKEHAFVDAAFGMLGIETALGVVRTALPDLSWTDVARVMSTTPARIAGLAEQGRPLEPGSPAHVVLVDPDTAVTVDRDASASLSRNNPWHGRSLTSRVVHTVYGGRVTVRDGALACPGVRPPWPVSRSETQGASRACRGAWVRPLAGESLTDSRAIAGVGWRQMALSGVAHLRCAATLAAGRRWVAADGAFRGGAPALGRHPQGWAVMCRHPRGRAAGRPHTAQAQWRSRGRRSRTLASPRSRSDVRPRVTVTALRSPVSTSVSARRSLTTLSEPVIRVR